MQNGSGKDKEMPDGMAELQTPPRIKNNPECITQPPGHNKPDSTRRHTGQQGIDGHNYDPAHAQIQTDLKNTPPAKRGQFEHDSGKGKSPYDAEQGPAPWSMQTDQGKRRIGSGNEQKNGGMIQDPHDRLGPG